MWKDIRVIALEVGILKHEMGFTGTGRGAVIILVIAPTSEMSEGGMMKVVGKTHTTHKTDTITALMSNPMAAMPTDTRIPVGMKMKR